MANNECLIIDIQTTPSWQVYSFSKGTLYLSGYVQGNKNVFTPRELVHGLDNCSSSEEIASFADGLYGNFGFIYRRKDTIIVVADKIRSIPIFYRDNPLKISSSAKKLLTNGSNMEVNITSYFEFLLAGYVTSNETLLEEVKQLRAGELIYILHGQLKTIRYYNYPSDRIWIGRSESDMIEELDAVYCEVFERIISSLQGAQVMLPLSGGLDSRLVAAMLKRLKYDNVFCFAYGKVGHWEVETSRKVAYQLGFKWQHFLYNHSSWKVWFNSIEYKNYSQKVDNFNTLPPLLDWPVVLKLSNKNPQRTVYMPGHTGDFICGGHLSYLFKEFDLSLEHLLKIILRKHFTLWSYKYLLKTCHCLIQKKLQYNLELKYPLTPQTMATAYEKWEWQERQAKYIVNTVRAYDYFGYNWRIPLWDPALLEFWSKVPLEWKLNKKLYQSYFERINPSGVFGLRTKHKRTTHGKKVKQKISSSPLGGLLMDSHQYLMKYGDYWTDNSQRYGLVPLQHFLTRRHHTRNINAFFTKLYLKNFQVRYCTDLLEVIKSKKLFDKYFLKLFSIEFL